MFVIWEVLRIIFVERCTMKLQIWGNPVYVSISGLSCTNRRTTWMFLKSEAKTLTSWDMEQRFRNQAKNDLIGQKYPWYPLRVKPSWIVLGSQFIRFQHLPQKLFWLHFVQVRGGTLHPSLYEQKEKEMAVEVFLIHFYACCFIFCTVVFIPVLLPHYFPSFCLILMTKVTIFERNGVKVLHL